MPDRRGSGGPGRLGDGYQVEVKIIVLQKKNVLLIPGGALFRRNGCWAAFVADGGHARLCEVQTGEADGVDVEVIRGLREGETVVLYPGDWIAEGAKIR